jgi:sugar O-acyltransferase (sialic acid O-acetyltransferase NeuD family)
MKRLLIFGTGTIGEVAHYYFCHDSDYSVIGFAADREYIKESAFCGLPIVAFEEAQETFSPENTDVFVALSYSKMNAVRKSKCEAAMAMGYRLASYVSSRAFVPSGFSAGFNCFILEDNTIQPFVKIGNNVTLWSGNHIGHHATIEDHCFIASHVVVSGGVTIGESCFVGVNATIRDHVVIGPRCVIGAGALILADAQPEGVYLGPTTERSKVPSSRLRRI